MVIRLALEWSSPRPSVALETPAGILQMEGETGRFQARHALAQVRSLLAEASIRPSALEELLVGVGPGNYSGMRMAIAIARGLAAPGSVPVHAVSSGRALLWKALEDLGSRPVRLLGDARRGRCWTSRADAAVDLVTSPPEWCLIERDALGELDAGEEVLWLSSEPDRLPERGDLKECLPSAENILTLSSALGFIHDELKPLYLHPPV